MLLLPISLLAWLVVAFCEENTTTTSGPISPCDDYYKYICSKINTSALTARFQDIRTLNVSQEIDQYQGYVLPTSEPAKRLWEVIDPVSVSTWVVQFMTYMDGRGWLAHQERHEETMKRARPEMFKSLEEHITPLPMKIVSIFYTSLRASCERLEELKMPVSTHNHFYHGLFDELRDLHISEIKKYSKYSIEQQQKLIDKINAVKVIFPFFEYNNVTVWREAKTAYEREYYRLKTIINETEIPEKTVERIIRIAAVEPAMVIFKNYIKEHTPRFVFQHVVATSTRDSFNYQDEIHASILTFLNPQTSPQDVYHRFLFVLSHELQHAYYNLDDPLFEAVAWDNERECLVNKINFFGEKWKINVPERDLEQVYYEDMSNTAGLRLVVLMNALKASDPQQIRDTIEQSMVFLCRIRNFPANHNPLDVSINVAASQIPTFNSLYNCKPGDRMYVKPEDLCTTLNMEIYDGDYETQKIDEEQLSVLTNLMDVLEDTALELDAANITTFQGELFDITVEDVENEEEMKEGSASSSSSSSDSSEKEKGEHDDEDLINSLDDDGKAEKAEIVSSARNELTILFFFAAIAAVFIL